MRRAERLFRLVNEMRTRGVSRASELAGHFEVSVSTIYRDIAHLQASGLPIEGEAGIGYLLRPGFDLPNVAFTHDQIDALAIGLSFVERTGDPVLVSAAREARAKIQAGMPEPEERRLADAPFFSLQNKHNASAHVALIRSAIRRKRIVGFDYRDSADNPTERRVCPLVVWDLTDGWMFSAWCELRQDFRTFRFDRMENLVLTEEVFTEDETRGLRAFMERESCEGHRS
ncbi:helix-turn-helix transcriptional regulator [Kiloniella sp. b19]|uniref:helix-turn-helix transcriptional regulator n=1 Tax=Kiloniella sp. GXU_MW_B19 TaxID=3141326 RepID=UPI0031CFCEDA